MNYEDKMRYTTIQNFSAVNLELLVKIQDETFPEEVEESYAVEVAGKISNMAYYGNNTETSDKKYIQRMLRDRYIAMSK